MKRGLRTEVRTASSSDAGHIDPAGLVGSLTDQYGSPGCLADYRRQFERTVRQDGEDPSKFAVAFETLAVNVFGDMDPNARTQLICDRFNAGHPNCALRRHLNSVPPETPIRDIADRCRVWESHADTDDQRVVKPTPEEAQPVHASEPTLRPTEQVDLEAMLKHLLPAIPAEAPPPHSAPTDIEAMLKRLIQAPQPRPATAHRDWASVLCFCGKTG